MIRLLSILVVGIAVSAFTAPKAFAADEPKEVTIEGKIGCGKCDLKESAKCAVTVYTTKDGKKTVYWFDAEASKKYHGDICTETKDGTVKGTVKKDGDKMVITVKELKYK
jgi:hypothetical protein